MEIKGYLGALSPAVHRLADKTRFLKLTPGTRVNGCTEHKQHGQFLYRAHPCYRGHNQWHDWASFVDWSNGSEDMMDDAPVLIPGQIVFFLQVTEEMIGIDVRG